ncbi:serine/threonine-protein kinase [Microterricola pindariensis]|nr:serine/threonine-protein kinase [Microterricola pindariensis]
MATYIRDVQIEQGGQGCVWRGRDVEGTEVALKYIRTSEGSEPTDEQMRRFEREISCQSTLRHPGIMPILAADFSDADPYFVMPLAESSLSELIGAHPDGIPEDQAVELFRKILDAVVYAHSEQVLHRDIKPANVLILDGEPRLSDFGLGRRWDSESTKLTKTNFGMGTFAYSAPEQLADGHSADARADIYALGRLFYEMLTGKVAFLGVDMDLIPGRYRYFLTTAMQVSSDKRHASAIDMSRQFQAITRDEPKGPESTGSVRELAELVNAGDSTKVAELAQLLMLHSGDPIVNLQEVVFIPAPVLEQLATLEPDAFRAAILAFDRFAAGRHPWSFTDTIARFLRDAFVAGDDIEVRRVIIVRLLRLGSSHNRFFVRERLLEVLRLVASDPTYTPVLIDVFANNQDVIPFSRAELLLLKLPASVSALIAGNAVPAAGEGAGPRFK